MTRSAGPPFRADHVGSLARPPFEGNEPTVDQQAARLSLCVEVAREVGGGL